MIKMRGLTLLCLVGFILTASWPKGDTVPLANTGTSQRQTRQIGTAARIPETDGEVKKNDSSPTKPKTDGEVIEWEPGSAFPMRSEHTFTNTTTNTSMETEEHKPDNRTVQATQLPVENTPGFPPPTVGEDTQG
ncbi:uncharacterized protein PEZ65_016821 isoform 1-T1 [Lycodopsis pacificus]